MEKREIRVLAVDDEELTLKFYREYFTVREFPIKTALTFEAALEVLGDWSADVVILDYMLPGSNGRDALVTLLEMYPQLKVVFVTAYSSEDLDSELLGLGAHAVLRKPCTMRDVFECVEKAAMTT